MTLRIKLALSTDRCDVRLPMGSAMRFGINTIAYGIGHIAVLLISCGVCGAKDRPIRFWNLTGDTVTQFALAAAGSDAFGPNQCANDRDGTVDFDERLPITGVMPGRYDAQLKLKNGRVCRALNLELRSGEVFSIEPKDLVACIP